MDTITGKFSNWVSQATDIEDKLSATLAETSREVAHLECFDVEQRAEIYSILEAIRKDVEVHRTTVGCWINDRTGEVSDV